MKSDDTKDLHGMAPDTSKVAVLVIDLVNDFEFPGGDKELDYTVCSIHSRFGLGKTDQTERILRAMDNRYFKILGHATGRLLLKRPGYEIDLERLIAHARQNGCFFCLFLGSSRRPRRRRLRQDRDD